MTATVYLQNRATAADIAAHLRACDAAFLPVLSERLDIDVYAEKLVQRAERFEAWIDSGLAGLVAAYCNAPEKSVAYITNVSVLPRWTRQGIAMQLLGSCVAYARRSGFATCGLQVALDKVHAVSLYEKHGFKVVRRDGGLLEMVLDLKLESANGL